MKKISDETISRFLSCLGRSNLGDGYIDAIVFALLKIIEKQNENNIF